MIRGRPSAFVRARVCAARRAVIYCRMESRSHFIRGKRRMDVCMKNTRRVLLCALCALALGMNTSRAVAGTRLYVFQAEAPPAELSATANAVAPEKTLISLTFAGDCTLGGETSSQASKHSFRSRVRENGMAYPFAGLKALFAADDFTIVNLEGVLSDSAEDKVKKQYNFIGEPAYTAVLTEGSVECVNLANNHSGDYGSRGRADTVNALNAAGVGWFDEDTLCVLEKDGVRVGLTATLFTLGAEKREKLDRQMEILRELGCAAIVHTMHAGEEYAPTAGAGQKKIAEAAVALGASLVVGHHPHVAQGAELTEGVPVVYSLGNCCFGGNFNPRDYDAVLLGAELRFREGALSELTWTLHPISQSADRRRNSFQPVLLSGGEAGRVMKKIQEASPKRLEPYVEGLGARQETIRYEGQEE